MRLKSNWLFFDIEGLKSHPTLQTAMSMVIANWWPTALPAAPASLDHGPRRVLGAPSAPRRVTA